MYCSHTHASLGHTEIMVYAEQFSGFFRRVLELALAGEDILSIHEQTKILVFLDHCFTSMEVDLVRAQVQRLVSLPMWMCLLDTRREAELKVSRW